jgi:hypothetical protein
MGNRPEREDLERIRCKYQRAGRKYKKILLDGFCELWGYHRKHAIRLLSAKPRKKGKRPGRPATYGAAERKVLKAIWLTADRPCSRRLKAIIGLWLPFYEHRHGPVDMSTRAKLLSISKNSIDRLLTPVRKRYGTRGRCGTRPGALLKNQIPIKTDHWDEAEPGFMEADTVAHCGNSLEGSFVWSLCFTDIFSGWTENRAVWNKGAHGVCTQIKNIEDQLPFALQGFHCDNGSEFLNHHLWSYFVDRQRPVRFTRTRPYRRNDNAHVEQKNWTHVRLLLGYQRIDIPELIPIINDLYRTWALFNNFFCPNLKLIEKHRVNSRYVKKYDAPKTPYQRLTQSDHLTELHKTHLCELMCNLDPFALKKQIERKRRQILNALR